MVVNNVKFEKTKISKMIYITTIEIEIETLRINIAFEIEIKMTKIIKMIDIRFNREIIINQTRKIDYETTKFKENKIELIAKRIITIK